MDDKPLLKNKRLLEKKALLKYKKEERLKAPAKTFFKKVAKGLSFVTLTTLLAGTALALNPTYALPTKEAVYDRLESLNIDTQYISIYDNFPNHIVNKILGDDVLTRLPIPKNSESYKININIIVDGEIRSWFEESFEEFNKIFEIINPNYKFEINFSPTVLDFLNPYSTTISLNRNLSKEGLTTLGTTITQKLPTQIGMGTMFSRIELAPEIFTDKHKAMKVIKHEFLHVLGLGDAYVQDDVKNLTIMQAGHNNNSYDLRKADVAMLDALYRSNDCQYTDAEIDEFINNYETTHNRYCIEKQKEAEFIENLLTNTYVDGQLRENHPDWEIEKIDKSTLYCIDNRFQNSTDGLQSISILTTIDKNKVITEEFDFLSYDSQPKHFKTIQKTDIYNNLPLINDYYYFRYGTYILGAYTYSNRGTLAIGISKLGTAYDESEFNKIVSDMNEKYNFAYQSQDLFKKISYLNVKIFENLRNYDLKTLDSSLVLKTTNTYDLENFLNSLEYNTQNDKTFGNLPIKFGQVKNRNNNNKYNNYNVLSNGILTKTTISEETPNPKESKPIIKDGFIIDGNIIYFKVNNYIVSLYYDYNITKNELNIVQANLFKETSLSYSEFRNQNITTEMQK